MKKLIYVAVATLMLVSCQGEVETPSPSTSETSINNPTFAIRNYSLSVNSGTEIIPIGQTEPGDFHYEYDDTNLSIWQNKIYVHKSNTTTTVKAIAKDGSFSSLMLLHLLIHTKVVNGLSKKKIGWHQLTSRM